MIVFEEKAFEWITKVNKVLWVSRRRTGVLIRRGRDTMDKHAQRKDPVRTQGEGRHMQAKE